MDAPAIVSVVSTICITVFGIAVLIAAAYIACK
jgi:hypothetical protein